ncbi:unnamed protein product [Lactuca virosa]|uniref:Uncharacterized protein n=1 Tax=Lactuca virosa TaxID=75947 RepID=A0AAU9PLY0_9ASTR|nr:unnamed protein product [Lactuca virosa]
MWIFGRKGESGFSSSSTAEEVTHGVDGSRLTAIVTGATSGIGAETARVLALRGVHVVMAVRNIKSGKQVRETILTETPIAKVDVMELDLSSQASVVLAEVELAEAELAWAVAMMHHQMSHEIQNPHLHEKIKVRGLDHQDI